MDSLIESFRGGVQSSEIFTLPDGINEFDICKVGSVYYFAHDTLTSTHLRSASSVAGLGADTPYEPVPGGRVPSILFDGTSWHLWVGSGTTAGAFHYTASSFKGVYTLIDAMPPNLGDIHVRKHSNGKYYAVYNRNMLVDRPCGVMVADSPYGPWTNLGPAFELLGRPGTHSGEEDDPALFDVDGHTYLIFSSWDGLPSGVQRPAICEINPDNGKAISQITNLVTPTLPWHLRNGKAKLYNAVFLREDDAPDRIYFSQNAQLAGSNSGWGYIEAGTAPTDNRRPENAVNLSFASACIDIASNTPATLHGSAVPSPAGLNVGPATGGAYGPVNVADIHDFAVLVDFTCSSLPASGNYAVLFRASRFVEDGNFIGLWIGTNGGVTRVYSQIGTAAPLVWSSTVAANVRNRVVMTRRGAAVIGFLNGGYDSQPTNAQALLGMQEWSAGNRKGNITAATQQLTGTVHRILMNAGGLSVSDL